MARNLKQGIFSLNIMMVGTRATGKTTYLTCVYGASKKTFLKEKAGTIELGLSSANTRSDIKKIDGWWEALSNGKSKMPATQSPFSYDFVIRYKNNTINGDVWPQSLLEIKWTDFRGGDYIHLADDDPESQYNTLRNIQEVSRQIKIRDITSAINENKYNAIMLFCKLDDIIQKSTSIYEKTNTNIGRIGVSNIIASIIEIRNNVDKKIPIVLIITHGAGKYANVKRFNKKTTDEFENFVYESKETVINILTEIARQYNKSFDIPWFYIDSVLAANNAKKYRSIEGMDDVRLPMLALFAQSGNIFNDIIAQRTDAPKRRTAGIKMADFGEKLHEMIWRSMDDRLREALELSADVTGIDVD